MARNPKKIKGRTAFFLFCDNLQRYCLCTAGRRCIPVVDVAVFLLWTLLYSYCGRCCIPIVNGAGCSPVDGRCGCFTNSFEAGCFRNQSLEARLWCQPIVVQRWYCGSNSLSKCNYRLTFKHGGLAPSRPPSSPPDPDLFTAGHSVPETIPAGERRPPKLQFQPARRMRAEHRRTTQRVEQGRQSLPQ